MATVLENMRKFINEGRDYISFVEFSNIKGAEGPYEIVFPRLGNVILWQGLSKEFCDAHELIMTQSEMHMVPASPFVYLIDGGGLRLQILKSMRYCKKRHWFPVTFRPGPFKGKVSKRALDKIARFDARHGNAE